MPKKLIAQLPSDLSRSNNTITTTALLSSPSGLTKHEELLQQIYATPNTINNNTTTNNCRSFQSGKLSGDLNASLYSPESAVIARKSSKNTAETRTSDSNRLSCNELECLKERFVDFIKLDATNTNSITNNVVLSKSGDEADEDFEEEEKIQNTGLMTKNPFPKSKSMQIYQDSNNTENYQTFNNSKSAKPQHQISQMPLKNLTGARYLSRLSVVSSEYSSAESTSSSSSSTSSSFAHNSRPEPPQRTVSIRNSTCIYSSSSSASSTSSSSISPTLSNEETQSRPEEPCYARLPMPIKEDTASLRSSSIYSTYRGGMPSSQSSFSISSNTNNSNIIYGGVRSSRSVFSIYEEEDECPSNKMGSNTTLTTANNKLPVSKLERLSDSDVRRIESMYRSIGCIVQVSSCTCDLYTTNSEQIAMLLNDCWNLEINSIVPVWLFDTGLNLKRKKQLRLLFVDRLTAFPVSAINPNQTPVIKALNKPMLITENNMPKNPDNDKRMTFTINNKQLVCLVQFNDFTSCQEFFSFMNDMAKNPKHADLFSRNGPEQVDSQNSKTPAMSSKFSFMRTYKNHSQSLLSLTKLNQTTKGGNVNRKSSKRYSECIEIEAMSFSSRLVNTSGRMKSSQTMDNLKISSSTNKLDKTSGCDRVRITGITKNCISNPCAFQHINSIKDGDKRAKAFVEYK